MPRCAPRNRRPTNLPHCAPLRPRTLDCAAKPWCCPHRPCSQGECLVTIRRPAVCQAAPPACAGRAGHHRRRAAAEQPHQGAGQPPAAPVETAINAEAVFKIVPREAVEEAETPSPMQAAARAAAKPKPVAPAPSPSRKPANEPSPADARRRRCRSCNLGRRWPDAAPTPATRSMMGKLRSATAAVQQIPQWAARSVAGWFARGRAAAPAGGNPGGIPGVDVASIIPRCSLTAPVAGQ